MAKQRLKNPSRAGEFPKAKAPNAPEMASKTFSVLRNFWVKLGERKDRLRLFRTIRKLLLLLVKALFKKEILIYLGIVAQTPSRFYIMGAWATFNKVKLLVRKIVAFAINGLIRMWVEDAQLAGLVIQPLYIEMLLLSHVKQK
jgi:hypothetical protein